MQVAKKTVRVIGLVISIMTSGWATEDSAKQTVTNLVTEIQAIAEKSGSQGEYSTVLKKYLDFDKIAKNVLRGVRKKIIADGGDANSADYKAFYEKFKESFTKYMISKYSDKENIDKFRSMKFEIQNIIDNDSYFSIISIFKSKKGPQGDVKIEWQAMKNNSLIFDMIFIEAAASFFKNEQSEATAKFKGNLDNLLTAYQ